MKVARKYEAGELVVAQSGCLACHKIGENGNDGPGPHLTEIGDKLPKAAIPRTLENPTAPMPSYRDLPEEKKAALVDFLAHPQGTPSRPHGVRRRLRAHPREGQVRAMFDRIAGFYDAMNSVMTAGLHHRWRERAADLAASGSATARSTSHRDRRPGDRARAASGPR